MCDKHVFAFHLAEAYKGQAVEQFEVSPQHPLAAHGAPDALGVYALYKDGGASPIYVGKATKITLAKRLTEHARKIDGRTGIALASMSCRYLVIGAARGEEWVAASCESALIGHYSPEWNKSGFGSHVPGAGRPGVRVNRWDTEYPPKP